MIERIQIRNIMSSVGNKDYVCMNSVLESMRERIVNEMAKSVFEKYTKYEVLYRNVSLNIDIIVATPDEFNEAIERKAREIIKGKI